MDLIILDNNMDAIHVIDTYQSFIWTDRYCAYGDFELYSPMRAGLLDNLKKDYYIQNHSSKHTMIIEKISISSDVETGSTATITGRSLESILDRRIIWGQKSLSGNLQNGIKELLTESIINPSDPNRKIDNILFEDSTDEYITGLTIEAQYNGDNLYDVVQKICDEKNIGFEMILVPASKNLLPYNSDFWEYGDWWDEGKDQDGVYVILKNLIPVTPDSKICCNINTEDPKYNMAIRTYDQDGVFIRNWTDPGSDGVIRTVSSDEKYLGVVLYALVSLSPWVLEPKEVAMAAIVDGVIKPFIGLAIADHIQTADEVNSKFLKFMLYYGADRSYDQTVLPYVIFSPRFDNLLNSNYIDSNSTFKNVNLVGGEGEGSVRKYASVGDASGMSRRELFTDASDISSDVGNHKILTTEEYQAVLQQRGNEILSLSENKTVESFEGEIETDTTFKYGEDFFNGDVVQIANEYGNEAKVRIVEMVISDDESGRSVYPTYKTVT